MIRSSLLILIGLVFVLFTSCNLFYPQGYDKIVSDSMFGNQSSSVSGSVPREGLVGEWLFNGNLNDTSGSGNHASSANYSLSPDRFNSENTAILLDINPVFVQQSATLETESMDSFSINIWFRNDITPSGFLFSLENNGYTVFTNLCLYTDNIGKIAVQNYTNSQTMGAPFADIILDMNSVAPQVWYQVTLVIDRSTETMKIYLNGQQIGSSFTVMVKNLVHPVLYFGGTGEFAMPPYCIIDDVRFYNRALTSDEVGALYHENDWSDTTGTTSSSSSIGVGAWYDLGGLLGTATPSDVILDVNSMGNLRVFCHEDGLYVMEYDSGSTDWTVSNIINGLNGLSLSGFSYGAFDSSDVYSFYNSGTGSVDVYNSGSLSFSYAGSYPHAVCKQNNSIPFFALATNNAIMGFTFPFNTSATNVVYSFGANTNVNRMVFASDGSYTYCAAETTSGLYLLRDDGGYPWTLINNFQGTTIMDAQLALDSTGNGTLAYRKSDSDSDINLIEFGSGGSSGWSSLVTLAGYIGGTIKKYALTRTDSYTFVVYTGGASTLSTFRLGAVTDTPDNIGTISAANPNSLTMKTFYGLPVVAFEDLYSGGKIRVLEFY
ncbi:MAG: hypothetical protein JXM68_08995 [Sedimentisphaerales bacterium]|nr:hypothetical protein [Sedimentisphaerales bacterium]